MAKLAIASPKYGKVYFLIDDEMLPILEIWKPRLLKGKGDNTDYIRCRYMGKEPTYLLHRILMGFPDKMVDHINGNGLDNRRSNLRLTDYTGNNGNAKTRKDNSVGFRGISKRGDKYVVRLQHNNIRYNLGSYDDLSSAKIAYVYKYFQLNGRFPR